ALGCEVVCDSTVLSHPLNHIHPRPQPALRHGPPCTSPLHHGAVRATAKWEFLDDQGTAGHVKHRGCLALGDSLDLQLAILGKEVSAFEARSTLVAIMIAMLRCVDYRCHSYLPTEAPTIVRSGGLRMARLLPGCNPLRIESCVFSLV